MLIVTPNTIEELTNTPIKSAPIEITPDLIDAYIELIGDANPVHQAGEGSLVPGNLIIGLIPQLVQSQIQWQGFSQLISAKYDVIKFLQPVSAGDQIHLECAYTQIRKQAAHYYASSDIHLIDGAGKKVLSASHMEIWTP